MLRVVVSPTSVLILMIFNRVMLVLFYILLWIRIRHVLKLLNCDIGPQAEMKSFFKNLVLIFLKNWFSADSENKTFDGPDSEPSLPATPTFHPPPPPQQARFVMQ